MGLSTIDAIKEDLKRINKRSKGNRKTDKTKSPKKKVNLYKVPSTVYPEQAAYINDLSPLVFVEAATKVGKTVGSLIKMDRVASGYAPYNNLGHKVSSGNRLLWVAPSNTQALMAFNLMYSKFRKNSKFVNFNRSKQTIYYKKTGAYIQFKTGSEPELLYGLESPMIVIDEASRTDTALYDMCSTLVLPFAGQINAIGNVNGTNNWVYKLLNDKKRSKEISKHNLTIDHAIKAGFVSKKDINRFKSILEKDVFNQIFYNIPIKGGEKLFAYAFAAIKKRSVKKVKLNLDLDILLSLDFNVDPMTATVYQYGDNFLHCLKEYKIKNSSVPELIGRFSKDFEGLFSSANLYVTGDPSGFSRSAAFGDHSYFYIMNALDLTEDNIIAPRAHLDEPRYRMVTNLFFRAVALGNVDFKLHPKCKNLITDFESVVVDNKQRIIKTGKNPYTGKSNAELTHLNDSFKYAIQTIFYIDLFSNLKDSVQGVLQLDNFIDAKGDLVEQTKNLIDLGV